MCSTALWNLSALEFIYFISLNILSPPHFGSINSLSPINQYLIFIKIEKYSLNLMISFFFGYNCTQKAIIPLNKLILILFLCLLEGIKILLNY